MLTGTESVISMSRQLKYIDGKGASPLGSCWLHVVLGVFYFSFCQCLNMAFSGVSVSPLLIRALVIGFRSPPLS